MKFTECGIKALKPSDKRYIAWKDDGDGLGIRVTPSGRKSFVFMYRFEGRPRMQTIGPFPKTSLADAGLKHAKARKLLDRGIDPGKEMVETNKENRNALTVKALAQEYIERYAKPRKRSWREDERILDKDILPAWKRKKAKDITRRDVITLLDEIVDRGAPIAANRTLAVIRKMFNFAASRDIVPATPCTAIAAPSAENRRDRVLTEKELKSFWNGLDKAKMSKGSKLALKFQLVTAQRKGEVVSAQWSEFDLDAGWWTIPAENAKNKLPHRVPLSPLALDLLADIKADSGNSRWLFHSPRGDKPITADSLSRAINKNRDKIDIAHFTPHDLRRTAASLMSSMGTSRVVISKILNHVESGITAVYDRHSYDKEKQQALDAWSRKLNAILTGKKGKVIEFTA